MRDTERKIKNEIINHYDLLIDENNDPVRDEPPLREYMDKWDGEIFIEKAELKKEKSVLEIGVGTGRLAVRTAPLCGKFCGIDISPKTIERARENLSEHKNAVLVCGNFLTARFSESFDVIYSSLTFMHIKEKQRAFDKVGKLITVGGRFVLSIDKNTSDVIDMGTRKLQIYPDSPEEILDCAKNAGFTLVEQSETEFAYVFVFENK